MPGREVSLELPCSKGIIKRRRCAREPRTRNTIHVMIISIPSSLNQGSLSQMKKLELNSFCLQEARAQCLGLYQCSRRCCYCLRLQSIDGWCAPEISQGHCGSNFPDFRSILHSSPRGKVFALAEQDNQVRVISFIDCYVWP